jgi:hypothetical protein
MERTLRILNQLEKEGILGFLAEILERHHLEKQWRQWTK